MIELKPIYINDPALVRALRDAIDNYIAVVCNEQDVDINDVKSDPVVASWIAALKNAEGGL